MVIILNPLDLELVEYLILFTYQILQIQIVRTGTINIFRLNSPTEPQIVKRNVGTIDYVKGEIKLFPINIISTEYKIEEHQLLKYQHRHIQMMLLDYRIFICN
jgi:hypothetical protein